MYWYLLFCISGIMLRRRKPIPIGTQNYGPFSWSFFFSNRFHPQQLNTKVCKLIENSVCFFPYAYVTKTTLNQRNGSNFCHFKAAKVREQITRKSNLYPFFLSQHYISTNRKDNMKYDFCKHALFYYALSAIFWSLLKTND